LKGFNIFDETCVFTDNAAEVHWARITELTKERVTWRKKVKTDGVEYCMSKWYAARGVASNKRHEKCDGDNYVPKDAFVFHHIGKRVDVPVDASSRVVDLSLAVSSGMVTAGRGKQRHRCGVVERDYYSSRRKSLRAPVMLSAARNMLKNLNKNP
jgi:hypothetical protein